MRKKMIFISCMAVLLLSSCASRKGIAYLQDMELGQRYLYDARYEATVHRNDRLSITVNCKRPELAIPFNAHGNSIHVLVLKFFQIQNCIRLIFFFLPVHRIP